MKIEPLERKLFFSKGVTQESMEELTKAIILINDDDEKLIKACELEDITYRPKPIEMYIDSYGGQVYACMGLISVMERSKTPIHTIVTGCAMSCGFMLLISGHKRFAYRLSTPMYHQVSTGFWGKIEDMEIDIVETRRLQKVFESETISKTQITKKKLDEIRKTKTDWFMTASDALALGIIDEIL